MSTITFTSFISHLSNVSNSSGVNEDPAAPKLATQSPHDICVKQSCAQTHAAHQIQTMEQLEVAMQGLANGTGSEQREVVEAAINSVFENGSEQDKAKLFVDLIKFRKDYSTILESLSQQGKLCGLNLSGRDDLNYLDMSGLKLSYTNFSGAKMYKSNLSNSMLNHADFTNAYMNKTILIDANLKHAIMYNAYLAEADLKNTQFNIADLDHAGLNKVKHMSALDMFLHSLRRSDWEKRNLGCERA